MTTRRPALAARLRTTALAAVLAASGFAVTATPATAPATSGSSPFEGIVQVADELFAPRAALAAFCASNAAFTGRLTASASSTTAVSRITDPDLYAYISDVDAAWSCTAYLRYSGVAWNTTASAGRFDWGNLINSTSVPCNYVPGSTDFIKANSTTDCPDTDAEYALMATLSAERVYQADVNHNTIGDFSYVHADCGTYYSGTVAGEPIQGDETTPESFAGSNVGNRPGANCDALTLDSTGTSQTITYDKTAPTGTSVSVNTGAAYTTATSVTLATAAADAVAGVAQMQFSNDNAAWSAPGAYATSASWTLTAGDGTKTVYARYLDANGNQSPSVSDTIVLDTTPPTGSVSISAGATYAASPGVTLTVSATDTLSPPVSQMRFSNDGSAWTTYPYATSHAWTLATGADGTRTVFAQFQNSAGSWSTGTGIKDTILLDASPAIPNPPDVTCAGTGVWQPAVNGVCYFRPSAAATLTVTGSATDAVSGVAHVRFQALSPTTSWTPTPALPNQDTASPYTEALGFTAATATSTIDVIARNGAGTDGAARHVSLTADATNPTASIVLPAANGAIAGPITITGTATDSQTFKEYQLEVGTGSTPASWTSLGTFTSPVSGATLGAWAPGTLSGAYTIRLTVRDRVGNSSAVTRLVYLENAGRGEETFLSRVPFDLGGGWGLDVGVANGEARLSRELFSIPSYGPAAGLDLAYSSTDLATAGSFGFGWRSNLTQSLSFESGFVAWHRADGGRVPFGQVAGTWTPLAGHFETLTAGTGSDAGRYIVTLKDQTRLVFEGSGAGRLLRNENRFGKSLTISWGTGTAILTDASGRTSTVTFTGSLITSLLDSAGRTWSFHYTPTTSELDAITEPDPDGAGSLAAPVTTLGYDASHRLTSVTRHRRTAAGGDDTIVWTVGYDAAGKATSVVDPIGHASYGDVANTFTYSTGSTVAALLKAYSPAVRNSTTYAFDALGRVTTITDPLAHATTQSWIPDSTLQSAEDPNGVQTVFTYTPDGRGNLATETADALGTPVTTRYVYNASNDLTETHVADGTSDEVVTTEAYDTAGSGGMPGHLVTLTRNATGASPEIARYAYTASDQVLAELDPKGVTTTHAYDANGNEIQSVANCTDTVPPANWWQCTATETHDAATNVTTAAVITLSAIAGKLGLPDSVTSVLTGRTTTFAYDALGRATAETSPDGQTSHEWDQLGNEFRTTEPGTLVTTSTLDLMNRATTEAAPLRTTITTYDATGAITQRTTASDTVSSTYDGAGQLTAETVDPGAAPHLNLTTEHAYDAAGRETATRDPDLTVTRTFYDADGRVTKTVDNCTSSGTTTWAAGDPGWKSCTGLGTNDATWNLTTTIAYDDRGNKIGEVAPNGRTTTWTYDDLDRVTRQVDNDVASPTVPTEDVTTEYAYDAAGYQAAVKSPTTGTSTGYRITRSFFDALGRVTRTIENCTESGTTPPADPAWRTCAGTGTRDAATNVETTVTYDADGNRLSVTAPSPAATSGTDLTTVTTRYAYDAAGRLCRVLENASVDLQGLADRCTTAVGGTTTSDASTRYTYDTRGNLATMIDGRDSTTTYGYDNTGRMTSLAEPGVTALTWAYNDAARTRTQTNRSTGTVTWTSDAAGRLVSRAYQDPTGAPRTTTYTYTGGNLAWTVTDGSSTISVSNDRPGRPTSVSVSGDTAATTTYGYSFTAPTRTDASGAYTMAVDRSGRLTSLIDPVHPGPWTFAYGADGALTTATMPTTTALTTTSTYDALGRLLTRTTTPGPRAAHTGTYNRAGNRLTEGSTISGDPGNGTATTAYDPLDRLTAYSLPGIRTIGSTFDAVPNRTSLVTDGTPVTTTFDAANRPTSGGYAYDADGRMTTRTGTAGTTLAYDSLGRLAEVRQNPGNTLVARYTYDALDRLLVVERATDRIRFRYAGTTTAVAQVVDDITNTVIRNVTTGPEGTVLQDWLGADRRLYGTNAHHDTIWTANDAGTVTATLRYDPWGTVIASSGSLPDWRFQGSWADTATNLAWSVARWYDPVQGTFITEDTLLGEPGSPASRHLSAYAQGDPVGGWDPSGQAASLAGAPKEVGAWCTTSQRANLVCAFAVTSQRWAERRMLARWPALPGGGRNPSWRGGKADAFRHCCWNGAMVRHMGVGWAEFIADDLYEMNEPITARNTPLHRRMDLYNNGQGRKIGAAVPFTERIHYLFGVEVWRSRAFDVELAAIEAGCLRALGRLRLLYLHR